MRVLVKHNVADNMLVPVITFEEQPSFLLLLDEVRIFQIPGIRFRVFTIGSYLLDESILWLDPRFEGSMLSVFAVTIEAAAGLFLSLIFLLLDCKEWVLDHVPEAKLVLIPTIFEVALPKHDRQSTRTVLVILIL